MEQKKLLITGSHAGTTAEAVIDEIKKRNLAFEIHWLGAKYNNLSNPGIVYHVFESGKIENKFTKNTISNFLKIPLDFFRGYKLIKEIKPLLTLSFGSAAGAIASFWSYFLDIPVVIHEQTATAGRANIISSYFAKKVLISRESSFKFFNKNNTILIGNPISSDIQKYTAFSRNQKVKSILVTGGSRGSTWINNAIKPIIPKLLERYYLMHQTGENNLEEFKDVKDDKYFAFGQIDPKNMAEIFSRADIVISRAGANTISELIALKKPAILIPIPWSFNDEQQKNAEYMESLGLARILAQKDLSAQKLLSVVESMIEDYPVVIKKTANLVSNDIHASEKLVDILEKYL